MVRPARLELATPGLGNRCSILLSYGRAGKPLILPRLLPEDHYTKQIGPRVRDHSGPQAPAPGGERTE
jgi:hypothetical protein